MLVLATCSLKLRNTELVFIENTYLIWVGKDLLDLSSEWLITNNPGNSCE